MGTCWQNWQATKVPYTPLPLVEMGTSLHQVIQIIQACGGGGGGKPHALLEHCVNYMYLKNQVFNQDFFLIQTFFLKGTNY